MLAVGLSLIAMIMMWNILDTVFLRFLEDWFILFEWQIYREKVFHPFILLPTGHNGQSLADPKSEASSQSPLQVQVLKVLILTLLLSQGISRKAKHKWSSQSLNWCPNEMLAPQSGGLAFWAMALAWLGFYFF